MTSAILITFVVLITAAMPVAFVLGMSAASGILLSPDGSYLLPALPQVLYNTLNSFTFVTIPLFVFAGSIMAEGGVAKSLMDMARVTVGRGRGGLGSSVLVSTLFFSGISGSSTADTAAIGKITLPSLKEQGYPAPFSTAVIAASGATAALVPPSTDFILIGVVANISIAGLFAGGIIPAVVNALGLMAYIIYVSRRRGYGVWEGRSWSFVEFLIVFLKAIPALVMMLIILGGILGGFFTPTEASAVAVAYGLVVSAVYYRTLTLARLLLIMRDTIQISGVVLLVITMGALLGYTLTIFQVPAGVAEALDYLTDSKIVFLLLVQILFFLIGMFMDTTPAILILMPILTPIAIARGIEPIHFGILVEANIALGFATPPVGSCLFTACAVAKIPIETVIRPLFPMILVLTATMMIITYEGEISMFLPRLFNLAY